MDLTLLLLIAVTLGLAIWLHLRLCELSATVEELNQAQESMLLDMDTMLQPMSMLVSNLQPPSPRFVSTSIASSMASVACGSDAPMEARTDPAGLCAVIEEVSEDDEDLQEEGDADEPGEEE